MVTQLLISTIILLSLFAGSASIWRWLSNLTIARTKVEDHANVPSPSCIVTLVHGTFARNAPWTSADSDLVGRLKAAGIGPVQIRCFSWSGWNSFGARARAAAALGRDVEAVHREHLNLPHYIIGHSHGGNVAISARLALSDKIIEGVVCLATPILTTCRRRLTKSRQTMIGFAFYLVLILPFIDWNAPPRDLTNLQLFVMLAAALGATLLTIMASSLARKLDNVRPASDLDPCRVTFIRAPFDEASGLIGTANFAGWILARTTSGPFNVLDRFEQPGSLGSMLRFVMRCLGGAATGGLAIIVAGEIQLGSWLAVASPLLFAIGVIAFVVSLALIALAVTARPLRLARERWWVMFILWPLFLAASILGGLLLLPALVVAGVVLAATVGIEMMICALFLEVTAEPCPAGHWTLRQLPAPPESQLRHSSVYASGQGIDEIISALAAMPGQHFRDRPPSAGVSFN